MPKKRDDECRHWREYNSAFTVVQVSDRASFRFQLLETDLALSLSCGISYAIPPESKCVRWQVYLDGWAVAWNATKRSRAIAGEKIRSR